MSTPSNAPGSEPTSRIDALQRSVEADEQLWVVLDPASAPDHAARVRSATGVESLFDQTRYARDDEVSPCVAPWERLTDALKRTALAAAADHAAAIWYSTRATAGEVLPILRDKLQGTLSDGSAIVVRWFDPRVLVPLRELLRPDQLARIDDAITSWHLLNRRNDWLHVPVRPVAVHASGSTVLDDDQVSRLLDASFDDRVLSLMRRAFPAQAILSDRVQAYAMIQSCTASAFAIGLRSEIDCAGYAALALHLGLGFDRSDDWVPWIRKLEDGTMSWSEVIRVRREQA